MTIPVTPKRKPAIKDSPFVKAVRTLQIDHDFAVADNKILKRDINMLNARVAAMGREHQKLKRRLAAKIKECRTGKAS